MRLSVFCLIRWRFWSASTLVSAFLLLATACSKSPDTVQEVPRATPAQQQALAQEFRALNDSLDATWARMMADDDEKIFYTNRLLDELEQVPGLDASRIAQLRAANARLKARRYAKGTMVSDSIDSYDRAQDAVLGQLTALVAKNPDPDRYPLVGKLAQEVQIHDQRVLFRRNDYDEVARKLNIFLFDHARDVPAAAGRPQLALFTLPPSP